MISTSAPGPRADPRGIKAADRNQLSPARLTESEQVLARSNIEDTVRDRRRGHHRLAELVLGDQLVFAARRQHIRVALFVGDVEVVSTDHRRTAESRRA